MSGSVPPGMIWVGLALVYLLLPLAWAYLMRWARRWQRFAAFLRGPHGTVLRATVRLVYSLGIPYGALLAGIADARRLGIVGFPRWPQLPAGALAILVGVLYLMWSWHRLATAIHRRSGHRRLLAATWQSLHVPWGWTYLLFDIICLQVRWAFVRGAAVWLLGLYPGVFVALAIEAGAWLAAPESIASLQDPARRAQSLLLAQMAILVALVFLLSENLWLCLLMHGVGVIGAALAAGRGWRQARA